MRYFVAHLVSESGDHYMFDWTAAGEPPGGCVDSKASLAYWTEVFERYPPPETGADNPGPGLAGTWLYLEDYICVGVLADKRTVILDLRRRLGRRASGPRP